METELGVAGFYPFFILRLLMVSVTIIGVACGGGYSGEGAAVVALGECGEDLLLPIIKWMCFACMIFEKLKTNQRQKCLNKCFCIKCKTKLHILCSFCSTFLKLLDNGDILAQSLSIICMCMLFFSCSEVCLLDDDNDDESSSSYRSTKCLSDGNRNPNV